MMSERQETKTIHELAPQTPAYLVRSAVFGKLKLHPPEGLGSVEEVADVCAQYCRIKGVAMDVNERGDMVFARKGQQSVGSVEKVKTPESQSGGS